MITLALEFSSNRRSVALVKDAEPLNEASHTEGRFTPIFTLIQEALDQTKIHRSEVSHIAVGVGPGSYAGIRRAIAAAQGWHLATGTPIAAVNSFSALARGLPMELQHQECLLAADAQRDEFVVAPVTGGELKGPLRLVPSGELRRWLTEGRRIISPDAREIGAAAIECYPTATQVG